MDRVQKSFTWNMQTSYQERLKYFDLFSHQRHSEKYIMIYLWRIAELQEPNLNPSIEFGPYSDRIGRLCKGSHVIPTPFVLIFSEGMPVGCLTYLPKYYGIFQIVI